MRRLRKWSLSAVATCVAGVLWMLAAGAAAEPSQNGFANLTGFEPSDIRFDPAIHQVTLTLPVQDSRGYYIPAARPGSFVVYDNGVRQKDVAVQIKRSPLSLGVLLEYGGRYRSLNDAITSAVSSATSYLLNDVGREDTVGVWTYGDALTQLSPPQQGREGLQHALRAMVSPPLSESNLYDALASALVPTGAVNGTKALLLISSGVDTFSKTSYEDLLNRIRAAHVPIFVINLTAMLRREASFDLSSVAYSRLDWSHANSRLAEIARTSGGRIYTPSSTMEFTALYDDLMERLRARYTVTYQRSSGSSSDGDPRTVRVELRDPTSGAPLLMADEHGRAVRANIAVARTYVPSVETKASAKDTEASAKNTG